MDFAITDYYGYCEHFKERLNRIKNVGFTSIMMSNDIRYKKNNGSFRARINYAKKIGLKLASLHASYHSYLLPEMAKINKIGDKLEKKLASEIKLAHKYGFKNLVVHLDCECNSIILERIKRLLELCDKFNVNMAIENLTETEIFEFIHKNIKHPHLKFCYDCGHNHCFTPNKNFFKDYSNLLTCVHLHDNNGSSDQHIPFGCGGSIDLHVLAKNLANTDLQSLDFEILPKQVVFANENMLLKTVYQNAVELNRLIEEYRNKTN